MGCPVGEPVWHRRSSILLRRYPSHVHSLHGQPTHVTQWGRKHSYYAGMPLLAPKMVSAEKKQPRRDTNFATDWHAGVVLSDKCLTATESTSPPKIFAVSRVDDSVWLVPHEDSSSHRVCSGKFENLLKFRMVRPLI